MTDKFTYKIEGAKELSRFLQKELPKNLQRTSALAGMRKSVKPMVQAAKDNAPFRSGALAASIKQKTVRKRDDNFAALVIAPMTNVPLAQALWMDRYADGNWSIGVKVRDPYYGKFQEFGYWNELFQRQMPGKYFMTGAFDTWQPFYRSSFVQHTKKKAIAAAKRHNAKSRANNKRNSR